MIGVGADPVLVVFEQLDQVAMESRRQACGVVVPEQDLADLLGLPAGAKPLAVLCLGPVEAFYPAPMLVLDDANLDAAVEAAAFGAYFNQGRVRGSKPSGILLSGRMVKPP